MSNLILEFLLWLFVINLGIALGAGLYESRIQVPQWLTGSKEAGYAWNRADVGLRFWAFVTTGPLTLLTLASLVALWWAPQPVRIWWVVAKALQWERLGHLRHAANFAGLLAALKTFAVFYAKAGL